LHGIRRNTNNAPRKKRALSSNFKTSPRIGWITQAQKTKIMTGRGGGPKKKKVGQATGVGTKGPSIGGERGWGNRAKSRGRKVAGEFKEHGGLQKKKPRRSKGGNAG